MELLSNRVNAYEALFAGEIPYQVQPGIEEIGLSGLWRVHTLKTGSVKEACAAHLDTVPQSVAEILIEHDRRAHEGDNEVIFGIVDGKVLTTVIDITSRTMRTWEKALWINGEDYIMRPIDSSVYPRIQSSRLAHSLASRSLVIEAAAAVLYALPLFSKDAFNPSSRAKERIAKILANWGPQFLKQWLDGSIIAWWLQQENLSANDIKDWQRVLTPSLRKHLAVNNINDPLGALKRIKDNLEALTDDAIVDRLGWTKEEVAELITPAVRKEYAAGNISDPFAGLDKMKRDLELITDEAVAEYLHLPLEDARTFLTLRDRKILIRNAGTPLNALRLLKTNLDLMSHEVLAGRLGWNRKKVAEIFTPYRLKQIALQRPRDPLGACDNIKTNLAQLTPEFIAKQIGWPLEKTQEVFTIHVRRFAAINNMADPLDFIVKLKVNLEILTDIAIANRFGWSGERVKAEVPMRVRREVAMRHPNDPLRALELLFKGNKGSPSSSPSSH